MTDNKTKNLKKKILKNDVKNQTMRKDQEEGIRKTRSTRAWFFTPST